MHLSKDQKLGVFFVAFAVLLVFIWVPLDVDTGYIETVRRQVSIGDALAPTIAGAFLLIGGLGLLLFGGTAGEADETDGRDGAALCRAVVRGLRPVIPGDAVCRPDGRCGVEPLHRR